MIIRVNKSTNIKVGALGRLWFKKGVYAYVGSAQNNLKARLTRHSMKKKKKHWHIDYLLSHKDVSLEKIFYKKAGKEQECKLACFLSKYEEAVTGFGSSDCRCNSHLFRLKSFKEIKQLEKKYKRFG